MLNAANLPSTVFVRPLYGAMGFAEQDAALNPAPEGSRKIVLATTIAETSLTIGGIGTVIDTGLKRSPRFDPASGMTSLETVRVSLARRISAGAAQAGWVRGFATGCGRRLKRAPFPPMTSQKF